MDSGSLVNYETPRLVYMIERGSLFSRDPNVCFILDRGNLVISTFGSADLSDLLTEPKCYVQVSEKW